MSPDQLDQLSRWFSANGLSLAGRPCMTMISGGRSNLTFRVEDDAGHRYVLRRPPMGHVLRNAHDMVREYRIIRSLGGTGVPVPAAFGACTDDRVLGAPFYVMSFVEGTVLATDLDGRTYPQAARAPASADLVDVLAAVHRVDVDAVGLGQLGRKDNYCERQLRRWRAQFHASTSRHLPLVDEVHERLARTIPPQRYTGLVHGDYRAGNVLFGRAGRIQAVLDWELAALGDTLADVGWLTATWCEPGEPELWESPARNEGFFTRAQILHRYTAATGCDLSRIRWYQAFALWRLSCIAEGILTRYRKGAMPDDGFNAEDLARRVVQLVEAAHDALASPV